MRRLQALAFFVMSTFAMLFLTCTGESPFKPGDATVTPVLENSAGRSNSATISDSVGKQITITLTAYLPSYIESVKVTVFGVTDTDTVCVFDKNTAWTRTQNINITFRSAGPRTVSIVVFAGGTEKTITAGIVILGKQVQNRPPVLEVSGMTNILTAQACSLSLSVQDSDAGQTHTFSLVNGLQGATLTGTTFKWTPPVGFTGTDSAVFSVTDNGTPPLSDTVTVYIVVNSSTTLQITAPLAAATSIVPGSTTSLSVTAAGSAPLTYQWYYNGTAITGATSNTYSKTWGVGDGGIYKVVVSNAAGSDSTKTTLTVAPVISPKLGLSTGFNQGSQGSLSITATGTAPISYQWYYNGSAISNATSSSYTIIWQYANAGTYKVSATNAAGTDTSSTVVSVKDVTSPTITLKGAADTTIAINSVWVDPGDSAWDDKDGVITSSVIASGTVNTLTIGKYTKTYNVSDAAGNAAAQKTRTVRVEGWELVNNSGIAVNGLTGFQMKLMNNNLYIAYVDNTDNKTYVKKLVGTSWQTVGGGPVDNITTNADMISLAVSPDGSIPYISYISPQTTNNAAIVSRLQGGAWQGIYTSQYDYSWGQYAEVEVGPDGSIYFLFGASSDHPEVVMKYNTSTNQMDSLLGIPQHTNYYQSEKDFHALACASDGTPFVAYRGPGGFSIKKKSGSNWIGAGPTAADSVFAVSYTQPLQTFFSGVNLFVLVSDRGLNPTFYDLKSGVWGGNMTITANGSVHSCLSGISDTAYVSYANDSVYVNEVVNGALKTVPEINSTGIAIAGTFDYSWVEAGAGIVYVAGRDKSTGVISLMKYVKQ